MHRVSIQLRGMGRRRSLNNRRSAERYLLLMAVRPGPSAELRARTRTHVWGEVADDQGRRAVSRLHGPEAGLVWTTIAALGAARKAMNGAAKAGYQTPASAFGKDLVLEGEGVTREDVG